MTDREKKIAEIEVRELLEGKRIMLSMTFHEASKELLAELDRERKENQKLREELNEAQQLFVESTIKLANEMQRHQKAENELRRDFDEELEQFRKERDKLIEGLRWYAEGWIDSRDEGQRAREILEEIGVTVE